MHDRVAVWTTQVVHMTFASRKLESVTYAYFKIA